MMSGGSALSGAAILALDQAALAWAPPAAGEPVQAPADRALPLIVDKERLGRVFAEAHWSSMVEIVW